MAHVASYVEGLSLLAQQMNEQVRLLVDHPGEKGRAAEHIARSLVRAVLPKKFAMGSGFIITSTGKRSPQLDIVLYDEQMNAPITLTGEIGVFPFECVYGSIEVKHKLTADSLTQTAISIGKVRRFRPAKYYVTPVLRHDGKLGWSEYQERLAPRSYLFTFDTSYRSVDALEKAMEKASSAHDAFFHGVLVLNKDWFVCQYATKKNQPKRFGRKPPGQSVSSP